MERIAEQMTTFESSEIYFYLIQISVYWENMLPMMIEVNRYYKYVNWT